MPFILDFCEYMIPSPLCDLEAFGCRSAEISEPETSALSVVLVTSDTQVFPSASLCLETLLTTGGICYAFILRIFKIILDELSETREFRNDFGCHTQTVLSFC